MPAQSQIADASAKPNHKDETPKPHHNSKKKPDQPRGSNMKIGFIGLGNMGAPMALNLLKAGHVLTVFDLNPESVQMLVRAGASAAVSPSAAVSGVECVITMLPAAAHVKSVLTGKVGVLAAVA